MYSEMIGSFIRTGNYPLEANYIFNSEEELKAFYANEINKTTLHKGLLKIVASKDSQTLYWVVQREEELQFVPLIQTDSIDKIFERLSQIRNDLNQEVSDRKNDISTIIGTDDITEFQNELNNLLAVSNAVVALQEKSNKNSDTLREIVGTDEDDIVKYLKSLDYNNLTNISILLHKFFDTIDKSDSKINTLLELQEFLKGFDFTKSLYQHLRDLWGEIQGTPTPNSKFRTLRDIQDFVETLASTSESRHWNLQTELDQIQVGVGLSGDGSYSPDQETNFLKSATSVMNALRTLDAKVKGAMDSKLTVLKSGYYDPSKEALVVVFEGSDTEYYIPASDLITEWDIENLEESPIKLEKVRVIEGGPDLLKADVSIDPGLENILEKRNGKLLVNGRFLLKYLEFDEGRKTLQLDNSDSISGKDTSGTGYNLVMISKWNKADFGSSKIPINLNGNEERPTYNDTKELALVSDLTKFITKDEANEQYSTKSELDWYEG